LKNYFHFHHPSKSEIEISILTLLSLYTLKEGITASRKQNPTSKAKSVPSEGEGHNPWLEKHCINQSNYLPF